MIQKKDSRKCSQQRDNPDNNGTPRTMAGQHRDNSGTIPTTTTDAIATISNLFPLLTARCLPQHLDNSGPPARRAAPTTVRGASPPTPFAGRSWRKSLAEHGLYDRRCGIYSCCLRSARKHEETQKRSSQEPPKRTPSFHSTTAAPTVTRASSSRSTRWAWTRCCASSVANCASCRKSSSLRLSVRVDWFALILRKV